MKGYRKKDENEGFEGTIEDYVMANHLNQKQTLDDYEISLERSVGISWAVEILF